MTNRKLHVTIQHLNHPSCNLVHLSVVPDLVDYAGADPGPGCEIVTTEMEQRLGRIPGMRILGDSAEGERCGCLSFTVEGIHAYDMSRFLDQYGIAARSGHHCAMPYLTAMGCEFAVRFSVAPYNTSDEIMYTSDTCEKICELIRNAVESGRKRRSIVRHAELCTPARSTGSDPS